MFYFVKAEFVPLFYYFAEKKYCFVSQGEKVLSFVPPDGNYRLLSYHITAGYVIFPYLIAYFCGRNFINKRIIVKIPAGSSLTSSAQGQLVFRDGLNSSI